eukprot:8795140-Pyramimonas_sp.AAC.1
MNVFIAEPRQVHGPSHSTGAMRARPASAPQHRRRARCQRDFTPPKRSGMNRGGPAKQPRWAPATLRCCCLLYTSDAADDTPC